MNYLKQEIKDGVKLHLIINDGFKTDFSVIFFSIPLEKDTIAKNAIIPAILRSGSKKHQDFQKITEELEMLYGASFDCGIDKTGDNLVLKFFIESINDDFFFFFFDNLIKSLKILIDIIFNPLVEKNKFNEKYVENEKHNLELIINSIKDDKDLYAYERCINQMYNNSGYGLSKYGQIEDLKDITPENLYTHYKKLVDTAKIDIIVCGHFSEEKIEQLVKDDELIKGLKPRKENIIINHFKKEIKEKIDGETVVKEQFEITQGKLVIGLDILPNDMEDFRFAAILYNGILGGGANSKLFQIVREKESLAYTTKSEYIVQKNNIFIRCGIECKNYDKTVNLIKKLLNDMKNGNFTDEEIRKVKDYVVSGIDSIDEEQDTQILFKFGQELSKLELSIEQYKQNIENVTREEIVKLANCIQINCIYFLENGGQDANN